MNIVCSIQNKYYICSSEGNKAGSIKNTTMSNYIFLTKAYNEGETIYYAIPADKIETLNLFETYDGYGQLVGHYNAGDYAIGNSASDAKADCEKAIEEKFNLTGVIISDDNVYSIYNEVVDYSFDDDSDFQKQVIDINDFIEEWKKENETLAEVEGFTYWDGHNFQTIITRIDDGEPTHNVVNDESLVRELNDAIENKSFEAKGFGCEVYSHDKWVVIDSNWQGTWELYQIMSLEDYAFKQPNSSALPALTNE